MACCKSSTNIPPADPKIAENLMMQTAQADRLIQLSERAFADDKARQVGVDALNEKATNQAMQIAAKAEQRADDAYSFYQTKGRPVIEQAFADASGYDSAGNIEAARGRATADVQQAFANTTGENMRSLSRLGINPSSGRFLQTQSRIAAEKAAAMAGAATNAEEGRRGGAIQLRQQAGNLASGLPAQSLAGNGQALGAGAQASGIATGGLGTNMAINSAHQGGAATGAGIYGSAAGGYTNLYGSNIQAANIRANQSNSNMSGWGSLLGVGLSMMADGGKVEGPGSGTSDDVPAVNKSSGQPIMLSNGEYVISADVVKKKGVEFFDKLQEKYHTPVNLGRGK